VSEAGTKKRRNKKIHAVIAKLKAVIGELEKENGPIDWKSAHHFMGVGEYGLACEMIELITNDQDIFVSKKADDQMNDAKRLMGMFPKKNERK
jgi:hypothetical protein